MEETSSRPTYATGTATTHLAVHHQAESFQPFLTSVRESKTFSFFGPYPQILTWVSSPASTEIDRATSSLLQNTDATNANTIKPTLLAFLNQAAADCTHCTEACWLDIRMTKPEGDFRVPRWHQDGAFFEHGSDPATAQPRSKWATTLLGPSTLFLDLDFSDVEIREYIGNSLEWKAAQEDNSENKRVAEYLQGKKGGKIVDVELGQVVRFSWGQAESPVHSEPDTSGGDRVFVSVLFGSEEELRETCQRRGSKWGEGMER